MKNEIGTQKDTKEYTEKSATPKARVNTPPNFIYCGDCLDILKKFPDKSVDLIYLDPPFFTNRHFEIIWKAEIRAFGDRWKGGINHYVSWMVERLEQCHRVLKDNGSLYLHCDWHASHYLKVATDKIFGLGNFKSQIIWQRSKSHNDPKQYGHIHDVILFYCKSKNYIWNQQYKPYDNDYTDKSYNKKDKKGRFKTSDLSAAKPGGDVSYEWKGVKPPKGRYWAYSKANMEKFEKEGRIYYSSTGLPYLKNYLDEMEGIPIQDLWTDIQAIPAASEERMGYPTQKPIALLERIVSISSNKGDIVLDPFCGCGTTLVAAQKLSRKWIGIDVSRTACKLMGKRMHIFGVSPHIKPPSASRPADGWTETNLSGSRTQKGSFHKK